MGDSLQDRIFYRKVSKDMKYGWVATLLMAGSLAAAPADFAGTWKIEYAGPPKTGPKTIGSVILSFLVDRDRVTGIAQIGSWPGVAPIANGKVEGDRISFTARGYLSSTTGIPTCLLEGTLSGGELAIKLSTIQNSGGPGSGAVWDYRGRKLDGDASKAAKLEALAFLSRPRRAYPQFPDSEVSAPLASGQLARRPAFDPARAGDALKLSAMIQRWEKTKASPSQLLSEGLTPLDLDRLMAFYSSPLGQSFVATAPRDEVTIQYAAAQFVADR